MKTYIGFGLDETARKTVSPSRKGLMRIFMRPDESFISTKEISLRKGNFVPNEAFTEISPPFSTNRFFTHGTREGGDKYINLFVYTGISFTNTRQPAGFASLSKSDIASFTEYPDREAKTAIKVPIQDIRVKRGNLIVYLFRTHGKDAITRASLPKGSDVLVSKGTVMTSKAYPNDKENEYISESKSFYRTRAPMKTWMRNVCGYDTQTVAGRVPMSFFHMAPLSKPIFMEKIKNGSFSPSPKDPQVIQMCKIMLLYHRIAKERSTHKESTDTVTTRSRELGYFLTVFCWSCVYAPDVYIGESGKIVPSDDGGDPTITGESDCEDYARLMISLKCWMFMLSTIMDSIEILDKETSFKELLAFSNLFVCASVLTGAYGGRVGSFGEKKIKGLSSAKKYNVIAAHDYAALIPIECVKTMTKTVTGSDYTDLRGPVPGEPHHDDLHVIHCEGTGPVEPLVSKSLPPDFERSNVSDSFMCPLTQEEVYSTSRDDTNFYKFVVSLLIPELLLRRKGGSDDLYHLEFYMSRRGEEKNETCVAWDTFNEGKGNDVVMSPIGGKISTKTFWVNGIQKLRRGVLPVVIKIPETMDIDMSNVTNAISNLVEEQRRLFSSAIDMDTERTWRFVGNYYVRTSSFSINGHLACILRFLESNRDESLCIIPQYTHVDNFSKVAKGMILIKRYRHK